MVSELERLIKEQTKDDRNDGVQKHKKERTIDPVVIDSQIEGHIHGLQDDTYHGLISDDI